MTQRILIADDEENLLVLVRSTLSGEYDVVEASDGRAALAAARLELPDLIILDWMMPVMTGIQVAEQLRADPRFDNSPIIMLTARSFERDRNSALESGVTQYLVKPFSPAVLLSIVRAALEDVSHASGK